MSTNWSVQMIFKNLCIRVLWMKVAAALEGLAESLNSNLVVANLANTYGVKNLKKVSETQANIYSSESTHRELFSEFQHDRVSRVFKKLCVLVLWMKVASAFEGLDESLNSYLVVANLANTYGVKITETHKQIDTHLRVLIESYTMSTNMAGFRGFSKSFASLCFG